MSSQCRACGSDKHLSLLLTLSKVPVAAQCFLKSVEGVSDDSIDLSIYQCSRCGHVQSSNPPVIYYKDVITASGSSPALLASRLDKLRDIENLCSFHQPRILEIGCSKGDNLFHFHQNGYNKLSGIENSLDSILASHSDIDFQQGYIDSSFLVSSSPFKYKTFDLILCYNFLEHMPDPYGFLSSIFDLLSPNGAIYCTVPSFDFIHRTSCVHEFIADHLSYFSISSISTLFSRACFDVLFANSLNNNNDLEILARPRNCSVTPP